MKMVLSRRCRWQFVSGEKVALGGVLLNFRILWNTILLQTRI